MTSSADVERYIENDITVSFRHEPGYAKRQRAFDLTVGLAALALSAPVMGLATLAIWLEDKGHPFFSQKRVGQYGRLFTIYKLRTMRLADCGYATAPETVDDSRVTFVGKILRKTSIDELPQLLNVVRGDMALVGPRPEMPFVVNRYERWQHCRHLRKPGITGLWQISVRKTIPLHHRDATKIDLEYIRNASSLTDAKIFVKTFLALVRPQGAY